MTFLYDLGYCNISIEDHQTTVLSRLLESLSMDKIVVDHVVAQGIAYTYVLHDRYILQTFYFEKFVLVRLTLTSQLCGIIRSNRCTD